MTRFGALIAMIFLMMIAGCTPVSMMSDYECLGSPRHTYAEVPQMPGAYACRRARGACERGFIQVEHSGDQCVANPMCEYVPGQCYCPPGVQCICGGGSPGQCQRRQP